MATAGRINGDPATHIWSPQGAWLVAARPTVANAPPANAHSTCGMSKPVQRFAPMEEHKDVEPPSGPIS